MKKNNWAAMVLGGVMLAGVCGCDSGADSRHPIFIQAVKLREAGKYQPAATEFKNFLASRPDSAEGHLQLATLYDESLNMPMQAIYHYQEYLRLAPQSSQAETVRHWQESAQRKYFDQLQAKFLPVSAATLQDQVAEFDQERETLAAENRELRSYIEQLKGQLKKQNDDLKKVQQAQRKLQQERDGIGQTLAAERNANQLESGNLYRQIESLEKQLAELRRWQESAAKALEEAARQELLRSDDGILRVSPEVSGAETGDLVAEASGGAAEPVPETVPGDAAAEKTVPPAGAAEERPASGGEDLQPVQLTRRQDGGETATLEDRPLPFGGESAGGAGVAVPLDDDKMVFALPPDEQNVKPVKTAVPVAGGLPEETAAVPPVEKTPSVKKAEPEVRIHEVQPGDTLSAIARRYYGAASRYKLILTANRNVLKSENSLQPGQKLIIPPLPAQE